jgi:MGT family glycosyltransferase
MKVAIIVPPFTGHINPTIPLLMSLYHRGDQVIIIGYEESLKNSIPPEHWSLIHPLTHVLSMEKFQQMASAQAKRGLNAFQFLWEDVLIPLANNSFTELKQKLIDFQPDYCIVDQQMLSGVLCCLSLRLKWFTTASTSGMLVGSLDILPQVKAWLVDQKKALLSTYALPLDQLQALDYSPHGVFIFSSFKLTTTAFPQMSIEPYFHFVGLSIGQRRKIPFDFDQINTNHPKILVSLGTLNAEYGQRFFEEVVHAFQGKALQIIVVAPKTIDIAWPENFIVQAQIPQLELLKKVNLVICHGGHNTVCEALNEGLPLLIAPIKDDQPIVAEQVQAVGAGIRIKFARIKGDELYALSMKLLEDPKYQEAALSIRAELQAMNATKLCLTAIDQSMNATQARG